MSIFKESFKNFVRKQIKIREAIISHGNKEGEARTNSPIVDLSNLGGPKELQLPSHAFYTNTLNRQCVIRMSSGVDLKETNELIKNNSNPYERKDDLINEGLALRYVLEGGTTMIDKSVKETEKETDSGGTKIVKETVFRAAPRSGFTGASKNRFGQTYGDPSIRANSADGYGIVPMPGIVDADIKTKSAYGSLREVKVNFVCHNIRQLEILELLYMRPGYPVLVEWGWTPFIDNEGKRRSDFPYISEWWDQDSTTNVINEKIIERKIETGGNYDGVIGMVKNFNYKARADGGFDCTTELTGMGEVLQALKGRDDVLGGDGKYETALEQFFKILMGYSSQKDKNSYDEGENWLSNTGTFFRKIAGATQNFFGVESGLQKARDLTDYLDINWIKTHANVNENIYGPFKDLQNGEIRDLILQSFMLRNDQDLIVEEDPEDEDEVIASVKSKNTYIRWDFLAHVLNRNIMERTQLGDSPLIYFKTDVIVNEDRDIIKNQDNSTSIEGKHIQPLAYTSKRLSPELIKEFKRLYNLALSDDRTNGWFGIGNGQFEEVFGEGAEDINDRLDDIEKLVESGGDLADVGIKTFEDLIRDDFLDMSIDPTVCMLPHQMRFIKEKNNDPNVKAFYNRPQPQFADDGVGNPKDMSQTTKYDKVIEMCNYDLDTNVEGVAERQIGQIFLNVEHLDRVYKSMRYNVGLSEAGTLDQSINDSFNMFDYIKRIFDDVNASCGGQHRFEIQTDNERPNVVRVIDIQFQPESKLDLEVKEGKIIELNIQSNDSIFRDYSYTSTVPSALMATIGVVAQNPDSISSLEQSTFSALNKNIRQRFSTPIKPDAPRIKTKAEKEDQDKKELEALKSAKIAQQGERTAFETSILDTFIAFCSLKVFYAKSLQGKYSDLDSDGKPKESKEIARQKQNLSTIISQITKTETKHLEDGTYADGSKFTKGDIKRKPVEQVSDIIPLKFNAQMDGIGGIIIGNVFKINPSRLPAAYKKTEGRQILFITMAEDQKITSGQDWTTTISGQLTIIASDVNEQATGTKIRKEGTGGNGGGSGQAGSVVISEEAKYEDNSAEESKVETKTPEQQQIEQQDQCPEGQYFDEELQACVLEEAVVEEKALIGNTGLTQEEIDAGKLESTKRRVNGPPPYTYAYLYQSAKNPQNGALAEEFFRGNDAKVNTINQKLKEMINLYESRYQYNFLIEDFPGLDNENVGAAYTRYEPWITALYEDFPELRNPPPARNIIETYRSIDIELTTWGDYRPDPTIVNGADVYEKAAATAGVAYNDSVYQEIEFTIAGSDFEELEDLKFDIDDAIEDWEDNNGTSAGLGSRTT
tara:strand:+ start:755 stop:4735 length:3981 start_codon:yes stop_codon:yes gene_type:complete